MQICRSLSNSTSDALIKDAVWFQRGKIPSPVPAVSPAVCTPAAALRSVCLYTAACLRAAPGLWLSDGQTHACTAPRRPLSPASGCLPGNSRSLYTNHLQHLQSVL